MGNFVRHRSFCLNAFAYDVINVEELVLSPAKVVSVDLYYVRYFAVKNYKFEIVKLFCGCQRLLKMINFSTEDVLSSWYLV